MRDAEKFKIGFLTKLAESGITPSEITGALEKRSTSAVLGGLGSLGKLGLIALPFGTGMLGGIAARQASQTDDPDVEELKTDERIAKYRELAQRIRERTQRTRGGLSG